MGPKCNKFSFFFSTIGEGWGEEWRPASFYTRYYIRRYYIRHWLLNEQSERQGTKVPRSILSICVWSGWSREHWTSALTLPSSRSKKWARAPKRCNMHCIKQALHKVAHLVSGTGSEFDMEMTINQVMITTGNPGTILHLTTVLQGGHWHQVW